MKENLNKKSTSKIEDSFLIDQQLQLTVEDDFSYFCKFDELFGTIDHPGSIHKKGDLPNSSESAKELSPQLTDKFEVEDDFSYFCMYDDLMGYVNIPVEEEVEEMEKSVPKISKIFDKKFTPNEYVQDLEVLFDFLSRKETKNNVGQYFKGEITPNELVSNANEETIHYIYRLINRVLNYRNKETRYYIKLPEDMFFNTQESSNSSYILACRLDETFENPHMLNLIGPNDYGYSTWFIEDYLEIDGNFSQIPNGTRLTTHDYLQIMKKYPNILEHISYLLKTDSKYSHEYTDKSDDEMHKFAIEHFQRWLGWHPKQDEDTSKVKANHEGVTTLSQETIDSITFVQPVEYVTLKEVKNGTFGSFEELLVKANNFQSSQIQDGETPKVLKLTSSRNTRNQ